MERAGAGRGRGRGGRKGEAAAKGNRAASGSKGREEDRRGDRGARAPHLAKAEEAQQAGKGAAAPSERKTSQKKKEPDRARAKGKLAPEETAASDTPSLWQALELTLAAGEAEESRQAGSGAAAPSGRRGSQKEPGQETAEGAARRRRKGKLISEEPGASDIPGLTQALGKFMLATEEWFEAEAATGTAAPSGRKASQKKKGAQEAREAEQAAAAAAASLLPPAEFALVKEPAPRRRAAVAPQKRVAFQKTKPLLKEEEEPGRPGKETASARRRAAPNSKEAWEPAAACAREKAEATNVWKWPAPGSYLVPEEPGPKGNHSLRKVLEKLKLAMEERSKAAQLVNRVREILVKAIKREACFSFIEVLGAGSYYEGLKIGSPNEFDIMLKVPDMRVELVPFSNTGAFYYVKLKRNPGKGRLDEFLDNEHLSSSHMLSALRDIIVKEVNKNKIEDVEVCVERKKPGSPAVTLLIGKSPSVISVDIILALEFRHRTWCESTKDGLCIKGWLGAKVKNAFLKEPLYLVPKNAKTGECLVENTWRLSFSHIEKAIMTNHGNSKTCCEKNGQKCCRKDCLKLLKYLLEQLKTKHENRNQFDNFHSYHAKTAFLHACSKWSQDNEWLAADLDKCFKRLLDYFLDCLREAQLQHFFIPEFNLFQSDEVLKAKCSILAKVIENEQKNGFPIFFL